MSELGFFDPATSVKAASVHVFQSSWHSAANPQSVN